MTLYHMTVADPGFGNGGTKMALIIHDLKTRILTTFTTINVETFIIIYKHKNRGKGGARASCAPLDLPLVYTHIW